MLWHMPRARCELPRSSTGRGNVRGRHHLLTQRAGRARRDGGARRLLEGEKNVRLRGAVGGCWCCAGGSGIGIVGHRDCGECGEAEERGERREAETSPTSTPQWLRGVMA
jgi:hypothetical protein